MCFVCSLTMSCPSLLADRYWYCPRAEKRLLCGMNVRKQKFFVFLLAFLGYILFLFCHFFFFFVPSSNCERAGRVCKHLTCVMTRVKISAVALAFLNIHIHIHKYKELASCRRSILIVRCLAYVNTIEVVYSIIDRLEIGTNARSCLPNAALLFLLAFIFVLNFFFLVPIPIYSEYCWAS